MKAFYICLIGGIILVILGTVISCTNYLTRSWCDNLPFNEYYQNEKCYKK